MVNFELFYQSSGVSTDTRNITENCLFICLKGDRFNGNVYAQEALDKGAKYVICDDPKYAKDDRIYCVENALTFLQKLANYHRRKFAIPIIGITGSNGKTTTKELINTVLSQKYCVLSTEGNLNNHIGVPLTLLKLNDEHTIAVIEMGANKPGDIAELCSICEPSHGIITNIGKAHLEGFGSLEGVLKTKTELYDFITRNNGIIFYNNDDSILNANKAITPNSISYGTKESSSVTGELTTMNPFICMNWRSKTVESSQLTCNMVGTYNFYNYLAAITIGNFFEVSTIEINNAIQSYTPSNNRSQIQKTNNNTLLLDAYNANPSSMKNTIESFEKMSNISKIMILGDMFELGNETSNEHKIIVDQVIKTNITCYFVGTHFFKTKTEDYSNLYFFEFKNELTQFIQESKPINQFILLKASRGIGLETITSFL